MLDSNEPVLVDSEPQFSEEAGMKVYCRLPIIQHRSIAQQFRLIKNLY